MSSPILARRARPTLLGNSENSRSSSACRDVGLYDSIEGQILIDGINSLVGVLGYPLSAAASNKDFPCPLTTQPNPAIPLCLAIPEQSG